jgi:hypothetical protein
MESSNEDVLITIILANDYALIFKNHFFNLTVVNDFLLPMSCTGNAKYCPEFSH